MIRQHNNVAWPSRGNPSELTGSQAFWLLVRRRGGLGLAGVIVGVALGALYCVFSPPCFESRTQLLVIKKQPQLTAEGAEGGGDLEQPVGEDLLATHMLILQSPQVVGDALAQGNLAQRPSILNALDTDEDSVEYVIDNLRISRGGEGQRRLAHTISLEFRHSSAQDGADVLASLVESYHRFLAKNLSSPVDDALALITRAKDEISSRLDKARRDYLVFREEAPLFWNGAEPSNIHRSRVEKLESALTEVQLLTIETGSRLQTLQRLYETNVDQVDLLPVSAAESPARLQVSSGTKPEMVATWQVARQPEYTESARAEFQELLALRLRRQELLGEFGTDHPKVRQSETLIRQFETILSEKRRELMRTSVSVVRQELLECQRREQEINRLLQIEKESAKALVCAEFQDEELRNELSRNQELFDAVLGRLRELDLAKSYGGFATEILAPIKAGEDVSLGKTIVLPLAGMMGMLIALSLGLVRDQIRWSGQASSDQRPQRSRVETNVTAMSSVEGDLQ